MAKTVPCLLCGEPMEIYASGNGKPYLDCFGCGVQVFIRRNSSVNRFDQLYGTAYKGNPSPTAAKTKAASEPEPKPTPAPEPKPTPAPARSSEPPAPPAKKRGGLIIDL